MKGKRGHGSLDRAKKFITEINPKEWEWDTQGNTYTVMCLSKTDARFIEAAPALVRILVREVERMARDYDWMHSEYIKMTDKLNAEEMEE